MSHAAAAPAACRRLLEKLMIELRSQPTPNGLKAMTMAAEGKWAVNIYDTKDNAARLAQATAR